MFKKLLALAAGVLITFAAYAAGAQYRADAPHTYVVKKGDTLWSISARFLKQPWLWPEIWDVNQQVHNPHRIYPGDVLSLDVNGLHMAQRASVQENPIPTVPLSEIKPFLQDLRVVSASQLKRTPYVIASEEAQPRATEGQDVYVRGLHGAAIGQRYAVVRPTHVFRESKFQSPVPVDVAHQLDNNVDIVPGPWQEDSRNDNMWGNSRHVLGVEVKVIGTVKVLANGDPATVLLTNASMEIRPGDRLMPVNDAPYDFTFYPHAPASAPNHAYVLALANSFDSISVEGPASVVVLNVGSKQGVDNGTTFAIYQSGGKVTDDVLGNSYRRRFNRKFQLPDLFVGHVMVFRTFDHVSYGLVMDGIRPVRIHDMLRSPD